MPSSCSVGKPGHLLGELGCESPPLTFDLLAEVTNDLGHSPHAQSHPPNEGGDSVTPDGACKHTG